MKRRKRILLIVLAGGLLLCLATAAASALSNAFLPRSSSGESPAALDPLDKARLAEAIHLRRALGELTWPGFGRFEAPLIVWNRAYSFLVGAPEAPAGWEAVPGDEFAGEPYYRQPSRDPQNFAVPLGDGFAASMATKSETDRFLMDVFRDFLPSLIEDIFPYRFLIQPSEVQISALSHETFHVFQEALASERLAAAEAAHRRDAAYWQAGAAMGEDWQAEIDLLLGAVAAEDPAQAAALARQFLEQRALRRARAALAPELVDYERQLEWEEGLAKYVELAIWRWASEHTGYIPTLLDDPDFKGYRTFPARLKQELGQLRRQARQEGEVRFYYSGMAQALLLDRLSPGWKERALHEGVWVEDLLREAVKNLE